MSPPLTIRAYHLQKPIYPSPFENRVMVSIKQTVPTMSAGAPARSDPRDWIRLTTFVAALVILVATTVCMHVQPPAPDPFHPANALAWQWWLYPIERNGFMRLPLVGSGPRRLFVLPGSTHAWVGGGGSSQLLHTADRGATWEAIAVTTGPTKPGTTHETRVRDYDDNGDLIGFIRTGPPGSPPANVEIADFYFADQSHGWVLDLGGYLLETRDGGKSWSSQWLSDTVYDVLAVSGSFMIAAGGNAISWSVSGGKKWDNRANDHAISTLDIAPDGRVWATDNYANTWWSLDGSKWERVGKPGNVSWGHAGILSEDKQGTVQIADDSGVLFTDAQHGFLQTFNGFVETKDGGRTWTAAQAESQPAGTGTFFRNERRSYRSTTGSGVIGLPNHRTGVDDQHTSKINALEEFGDHKHAIALGKNGQILVTRDGNSWRRVTAPYGFVAGLHADADGRRIWTAGSTGTMLRSLDGGSTWEPLATATRADLSAVTFTPGETRGWTVSDDGGVMQTNDGGRTWRSTHHPLRYSTSRQNDRTVLASDNGMHVIVGHEFSADYIEAMNGGTTGWKQHVAQDFSSPNFFSADNDQWTAETYSSTGSRFIRYCPRGTITSIIPTRVSRITANGEDGWVAAGSFPTHRSVDGGHTWQRTGARQDVSITAIRFVTAIHGFAEAEDGSKFETNDRGTYWQPMRDETSWRVQQLVANKGATRMWTTSIDGVPLRSVDGGKTWLAPEYRRFPAPWYFVTLAPVALLLLVAMKKPVPPPARHSIEDVPWNDKPLTDPAGDRLDFGPLASGIARFFGNLRTEPPLTIAITGPWGSGKSSLMSLVAAAVKRYDYRPVWFNAWHYQSEEYLLPAVLESIRTEAVPRWWTWRGLEFRMRLLLLRGMKNWLPALAIVAALVTTAVYFSREPEAFRQLVDNLKSLGTQKSDTFLQSFGLVISSILSIIVVARSLNAFGVSGTKLTAILTGSVRLADAGGQTGFRHRFARAFGEVTRALGRNRLVLFIDDLDRCRPDHVLSVLECINFLVTSGDCFIIAGMDRPRVERCVAIRFEEESKAIGADENAEGENDPVTPVRYAQLYLEKLINIEVPVPHAAPERSRDLFANLKRQDDEEHVRTTAFGHRITAFVQATIPWAVGISVIAGAAYLGYTVLPNRLQPTLPPQPRVVSTPAAAPKPAPPGPPVPNTDTKPPQAVAQTGPPARFVVPPQTTNREILPIIGIILVFAFGIIRLSLERAKLEQDSDDFRTALRLWHPLLYYTGATGATPRSMKRCVNRVRYYAMRQRTNPLPPTLPERLARLLERVLRRPRKADDEVTLEIPERILVPVSVVQDRFPSWLEDDAFWLDPATYVESRCPIEKLAEGIAALRACGSIVTYRKAFERISAGIHVAGAAKDAATARTATS
jgi:photosystem II stability/assembly factor-like uncharacterized protein